jgi:hypothetical protein
VLVEVHAAAHELDAFLKKKLALEGSVRFADQDAASGAKHAMPRYAASRRAGRHGAPGCARASAQTYSARHLSIS